MYKQIAIALAASLFLGCGDDGADPASGPNAGAGGAGAGAGGTGGSGGQNAGSGAGAAAGAGEGGTSGAAGSTEPPDAGAMPVECEDGAVLCAGECVSEDNPQAGSCRYLGHYGEATTLFEDGDGFYMGGTSPAYLIARVSFADGSAEPVAGVTEAVFAVVADDEFVYFVTDLHSSATLGHLVHALKRVPRAGGEPELLVDDLSEFHVLELHDGELLVGASQGEGEQGLLRFATDGTALGTLVPEPTLAFEFVADQLVYLQYDFASGKPKVAPASGGLGEPLLTGYTAAQIAGVHEGVAYFAGQAAIYSSDLATREQEVWQTDQEITVGATQPGVFYWFDGRAGALKRVALGDTPAVETLAEVGNVQFPTELLVRDRTAYLAAAYGTRRSQGYIVAIDF